MITVDFQKETFSPVDNFSNKIKQMSREQLEAIAIQFFNDIITLQESYSQEVKQLKKRLSRYE